MVKKAFLFAVIVFFAVFSRLLAQDDLLALIKDSTMPDLGKAKVYATFKTTKLINTQTIETVKKRTLDFRITHRFGNIGGASGGGVHTLYGFDNSDDIRFSFDFGITNNLQIGVGRSKVNELLDGSVKWRFLEQTVNNKVPLSVCFFGSTGLTPQRESSLYPANVIIPNKGNFAHRINYFSELVIARKFSERFSMQVLPAFHYRNFIVANVNPDNGNAVETNGLFVIGTGGRMKITKRIAIIADYYYIVSKYRQNNKSVPYENPFAVGVEIETGGHVFHLTFTNASGIVENNLIPNTRDRWFKGGFKFGFNISRVFNL